METLQERHQQRLLTDPDLIHLSDELKLINERREKKQLSLNKEVRQEEIKAYDNLLLSMENKRRKAKGLPTYASIEEWREASDPEDEEEDTRALSEKDPILYEVGNILADYMGLPYTLLSQAKNQ
jgi:carboxyl-terminal processing protease